MVLMGLAGACSTDERPPATDLARETSAAEATGSEPTGSTDATPATDATEGYDSTEVGETFEEPQPGAVAAGGSAVELPRFATVIELLAAMGDHAGPDTCTEEINGDPTAVQVCVDFLNYDDKASLPRRVRSEIVFVVFEVFAMTSLDKVTVSAVPMSLIDADTPEGLLEEYRETITVRREDADRVLREYHGTTDYSILMEQQGPFWTTTDAFDVLMLRKSDEVFARLAK